MPKLAGVTMVKDEIDILPFVLSHLVSQDVDLFVIADNMSTDGTWEFLLDWATMSKSGGAEVILTRDEEVGYYQDQKMNGLISTAVDNGADLILPFDADEMFYPLYPHTTIKEAMINMPYDITVATVWNHVPSVHDHPRGNPLVDTQWREDVVKSLPSVAFRWQEGARVTMGNHDVIAAGERDYTTLEVRHFQYRSLDQYKRKVRNGKAAYEATDFDEGVGYHWRWQGSLSDEAIEGKWIEFTNQPDLVYDPAPYTGEL